MRKECPLANFDRHWTATFIDEITQCRRGKDNVNSWVPASPSNVRSILKGYKVVLA